ncbi:MAG: NUDIX hydrolase [Spirochaetales bacterium]|nr:NUDIX hydrolase [Spirochaetales bacterium]
MEENKNEYLHWKEIDRKILADCHIFKVVSALREDPYGSRVDRFLLDAPDWVTVIPIVESDEGEKCLMVKQYRHGSSSVTREFPAGTVDPGEKPEDAMHRELLEETGYTAGEMVLLGAVNPNSAFMNNTQYIYAARDLKKVGGQDLDEHEEVEFELLLLSEVLEKMGRGDFSNGTMMTALGFFMRWRSADGEK